MSRPGGLARCITILGGCGLGLLTTGIPAFCLTTLIVIPTAETIGAGKYRAAAQAEGAEFGLGDSTWALKTKFGLGERVEAGVNFDLGSDADTMLLWKAKYVFPVQKDNRTAAGVGLDSLGKHSKFAPYAVVTHDLRIAHVHLGLVRAESAIRFFVGADGKVGERWHAMADYTNGTGNFASVGAEYDLDDHWRLRAGVLIPNDAHNPQVSIEFKYTSLYR